MSDEQGQTTVITIYNTTTIVVQGKGYIDGKLNGFHLF